MDELMHQAQHTRECRNPIANLRADLNGTEARLVEVDNELGAVRGDLSTARHAIVELDDALTALRAEFAEFKQHVEAFARLAGETEADKPGHEEYNHSRAKEDARNAWQATRRQCGLDTVDDCQGEVVWLWHRNAQTGDRVYLCDEHAKDIDLSDLEDLAEPS